MITASISIVVIGLLRLSSFVFSSATLYFSRNFSLSPRFPNFLAYCLHCNFLQSFVFLCISVVWVVVYPLSFMIVFIWVLSLFFLMSLLKGLLIWFIFLNNLLLDLLVLRIVLLVSVLFNSDLILVISFLLFSLGSVCFCYSISYRCIVRWFIWLFFFGRSVLLWTSPSGLPSLCTISFVLSWVHLHFFPETFWFLP